MEWVEVEKKNLISPDESSTRAVNSSLNLHIIDNYDEMEIEAFIDLKKRVDKAIREKENGKSIFKSQSKPLPELPKKKKKSKKLTILQILEQKIDDFHNKMDQATSKRTLKI